MDAKTKALRRKYDKLEDMERFKALLAAEERGDESEIEALWKTAPSKDYTFKPAWPFNGMVDAMHKIGWACVTDALRHGFNMTLTWAVLQMRDAEYERASDEEREALDAEDKELDKEFDMVKCLHDSAERTVGAWEALRVFCEELGVSMDQALTQAPGADAAQAAVGLARHYVGAWDTDYRDHLDRVFDEVGGDEDGPEFWANYEAQRRAEQIREDVGLLWQIWEKYTA